MSTISRLLALIVLVASLGGCVTTGRMNPTGSSPTLGFAAQDVRRPPLQVPGIETPQGTFPAVIIGYSDPDEFGQATYLFYDWRVGDAADQYPKKLASAVCDSLQDLPNGSVAYIIEVYVSGFDGQSPAYKIMCERREFG